MAVMLTRAAVLAVVAALGLAPGVAARARHARHAGIRASTVKNEVGVTLETANLSRALTSMPPVRFGVLRPAIPAITMNDTIRYQRMLGFGAAMTDTSAWLLYEELPPARPWGRWLLCSAPTAFTWITCGCRWPRRTSRTTGCRTAMTTCRLGKAIRRWQVSLWHALRMAGVETNIDDYGQLFTRRLADAA
jgi:hypothetical protein